MERDDCHGRHSRPLRARHATKLRFGIEEEYFLVDAAIGSVVRTMPEAFFEAAKKAVKDTCGGQVTSEMLQGQIEVATAPHTDMRAAREELRHLRRTWQRSEPSTGLRFSPQARIRPRAGKMPARPNPSGTTR
jgi:carboxylate-amine ligase